RTPAPLPFPLPSIQNARLRARRSPDGACARRSDFLLLTYLLCPAKGPPSVVELDLLQYEVPTGKDLPLTGRSTSIANKVIHRAVDSLREACLCTSLAWFPDNWSFGMEPQSCAHLSPS